MPNNGDFLISWLQEAMEWKEREKEIGKERSVGILPYPNHQSAENERRILWAKFATRK